MTHFLIGLAVLLPVTSISAAMTSTNYEIRWDSLRPGMGDDASSASYQLRSTIGDVGAGISESSSYDLAAGYRSSIYDRTVAFDVYGQDRSSQIGASSLSGTSVTVSSASGYSVGDMIAVVQDEGASQIAAIAKISQISGSVITVDAWTDGGTAPTIDGSSDYVYQLDATSISLGTLTDSTVATSIIAWEVNSEVDEGYTVYIYEDGELTDGSESITDVADGEVSAGSTEYGARSSQTSLAGSTFDTEDTAITAAYDEVAEQSDFARADRGFITLKAGMAAGLTAGSYSQVVNLLYAGDF